MSGTGSSAEREGWWYARGCWNEGERLIEWVDGAKSWCAAARASGFTLVVGDEDDNSVLATVNVYRSTASGAYAVVINSPDGGEVVYANSFPDAMSIVAQWSPALQALNASSQDVVIGDGICRGVDYLSQADPDAHDGITQLVRLVVKAAR